MFYVWIILKKYKYNKMVFLFFFTLLILTHGYKFNFKLPENLFSYDEKYSNIILRRSKLIYNHSNYTEFEQKYKEKVFNLTPAGINGFYMLGIIKRMNEIYDMDNFIFSGASAGSWNGLILSSYKRKEMFDNIERHPYFFKIKKFHELQRFMKNYFLTNYKSSDFNFTKLFIGVTQYQGFHMYTNIFSDFYNLEDCLDCCIASSHIPLITNGLIQKYDEKFTFDGGFSSNPYVKYGHVIAPNMYRELEDGLNPGKDAKQLYKEGYDDTVNLNEKMY